MGAREIYREIIVENIGYAYLTQDSHIDQEQFDKIVKLIVDTVCSARKTICIAGDDYPAEVVKSWFMKLEFALKKDTAAEQPLTTVLAAPIATTPSRPF